MLRVQAEEFARRIAHPAIFDTVREPLLVLDDEFQVIRASASFYRVFDESAENVLGRSLFSLGDNLWDIPSLHDILEKVLPERSSFDDFQVDQIFPSIGRRVFHLNAREIVSEKASPRFILLAFQDITQKVWADRRLKKKSAELERSNSELEQFASIAAHDLQSPLNKISSFTDLLTTSANERLTDQEKSYLEMLSRQSQRMRLLMQDLLVFAEIASQDQPLEDVDLATLVNDVISNLQNEVTESNAKIEIGKLTRVRGRKARLMQLLQNLIQNALKYRKKDVPPLIFVSSNLREDGALVLSVKDNGIGFEQKYAEQIFEPFRRLHGSGSEYKGTGMGLAICHRVMADHGGSIRALSTPGQGATFFSTFPAVSQNPNQSIIGSIETESN
jgi:two-component system CheB/CheR fusion protein